MRTFQDEPLTQLPKTLDVTQQMLVISNKHLSTLASLKNAPAPPDKAIINASRQIFTDLNTVFPVFEQFCRNWKQQDLTQMQKGHIKDVETNLKELQRLNAQLMFLLDYFEDETAMGKEINDE